MLNAKSLKFVLRELPRTRSEVNVECIECRVLEMQEADKSIKDAESIVVGHERRQTLN